MAASRDADMKRMPAASMTPLLRFTLRRGAGIGAALWLPASPVPAVAQQTSPTAPIAAAAPQAKTTAPVKLELDSKALEVLRAASTRLAAAHTPAFTAVETFESLSRQGVPAGLR